VTRWNRFIAGSGIKFEIRLPRVAFNRAIGEFTDIDVSPTGEVLTEDDWKAYRDGWLPASDDKTFVESLMQLEVRPGHFAGWISQPTKGIQNQPEDFLYVRLPWQDTLERWPETHGGSLDQNTDRATRCGVRTVTIRFLCHFSDANTSLIHHRWRPCETNASGKWSQ
jgi:hypothetical protein